MLSTYPAYFFKEDNVYSVIFPDLNFLATCGANLEEAFSMAIECLGQRLYWLAHDNEEIHIASDLTSIDPYKIAQQPGFTPQSAFVNMVAVDVEVFAKNDEFIVYASKNLHNYKTSDRLLQERCRAREDYENHERVMLESIVQAIAKKDIGIEQKVLTLIPILKKLRKNNVSDE